MTKDKTATTGAPAFPFPTTEDHPVDAEPAHAPTTESPTEDALDHGIEESFPASDPVSVSVTKLVPTRAGITPPSSEESVAGEEDPGASMDLLSPHVGDESPPGVPGTSEGICRDCGGQGRQDNGSPCPACDGTGKVTGVVGDA